MGGQQQVTNFKVKVKIFDPPKRIRPGMSSTVNIISETIKNTISFLYRLLHLDQKISEINGDKKEGEKWEANDDKSYSDIKESLDVFFLVDDFDGESIRRRKICAS